MSTDYHLDECGRHLPRIVVDVFNTMLDTQVTVARVAWDPNAESIIGIVRFSGSWVGAISFQCSLWQAARFTRQITHSDSPTGLTPMVRDVIAELTNVVTGNVRCCFPRGMVVSHPLVVYGTDHSILGCGSVVRQAFLVEGGEIFWIGLRGTTASASQSDILAIVA